MAALNSNMKSDFKPEVVYGWNCACAVKNCQNRRKADSGGTISTSYRKSMWLDPFSLSATDLRPKVEPVHLLRMRRHYCHVWNTRYWTDSEFAWTLSCYCKKSPLKPIRAPSFLVPPHKNYWGDKVKIWHSWLRRRIEHNAKFGNNRIAGSSSSNGRKPWNITFRPAFCQWFFTFYVMLFLNKATEGILERF